MDLLSKAKLFSNYSLAFGKTYKVLNKASEYLPKDFNSLIKVLESKKGSNQITESLAQDYVINSFYKALSTRFDKIEFENWKPAMKAAMISHKINAWLEIPEYQKTFVAALVRDLPIMILRHEDKENYKKFEQQMLEGKSVNEASLLCFGIGLEEYVEQFAKHFNFTNVEGKQENILDFSFKLAESFSNKEQKASSLWLSTQDDMKKVGLEMDEDLWANHISILFVKTLETEAKFK